MPAASAIDSRGLGRLHVPQGASQTFAGKLGVAAAQGQNVPGCPCRVNLEQGSFEELLSPEETQLPNGMAWNVQKRLMYFVDTGACSIAAYSTDEAGMPVRGPDGRLQQSHSFVVDVDADGAPDGMTIDRCQEYKMCWLHMPCAVLCVPACFHMWSLRNLRPKHCMPACRDGNLWVALAEGSAVACYCADTGKQLQKVRP